MIKRQVYIGGTNIITSLGFTTEENFRNILSGTTGVKTGMYDDLYPEEFPASLVNSSELLRRSREFSIDQDYTRFEQMIILSIEDAISRFHVDPRASNTFIILSTTKGNISLLKNSRGFAEDRVHLWKSAHAIGTYFDSFHKPLVISNACVSGVMALIAAQRLIKTDCFRDVIVCGCDELSEFIVSGFQAFFSLSKDVCKPFDKERSGLSLGEGAATMILTSNKAMFDEPTIEITGGSGSNDANHISGPSRTGEGLYIAINDVMKGKTDLDFISAHGTATAYNDDMESIAFSRSGLSHIPVNSYKGYIGHTLGAAGVIESVLCFETMRNDLLVKSYGFTNPGTTEKLEVIDKNRAHSVRRVLKTASGFGGSNAVILFEKKRWIS
jgi:3-oxoacyl-[acyl-carrier-protein] synthase-1